MVRIRVSVFMPKTDLVPCFYREQDAQREKPAQLLPREQVRAFKEQLLGVFICHGRCFRFFQSSPPALRQAGRVLWDGLLGTGNLLPFAKVQNRLMQPEKLHYPVPACGARDRRTSVYQTNYLPPEMQRSARA